MDVRQLRHFVAVAELLHFGRAAEQLGMTQPPLSQSIIALERKLGSKLFVRTKRHVSLTAFGTQLLEKVAPVLRQLDALEDIAQLLRDGRVGRLTLSFVSIADYNLLPRLVQEFTTLWPDVDLRLHEATSDMQIPALLEARCQAGIIIPPTSPLPDALDFMPLPEEPLVAAVPQKWMAQGRLALTEGYITGERLAGLPLIIFPREVAPSFHDVVKAYVADRDGRVHVTQQAIQMQTIISLVSAGIGMALVPVSLRNMARSGVQYLDLQDPPMLRTGIIWNKEDDAPTLRHLLAIARNLCGDR